MKVGPLMPRERPATMRNFFAWIALSAYGHPAPILGFAFTRKELKRMYSEKFKSDLEVAGYRLVKVVVAEVQKAQR